MCLTQRVSAPCFERQPSNLRPRLGPRLQQDPSPHLRSCVYQPPSAHILPPISGKGFCMLLPRREHVRNGVVSRLESMALSVPSPQDKPEGGEPQLRQARVIPQDQVPLVSHGSEDLTICADERCRVLGRGVV